MKYLGFSINKYDIFGSNKIINGKECTIVRGFDDKKLSHIYPTLVTDILEEIKKDFGDLVIGRVDTHDLLGMNKKIRNDNKVELIARYLI